MIVKTSPDEIENFFTDASNFKGTCDAVYFPETLPEAAEILTKSNKEKVKVTISGGGTGLTGARVPQGGIVLSTEKLNRIIEINSLESYASAEPGVILENFHEASDELGLLYPPDPTEQKCFLGGTIATNASGARTFKYGSTRQYVSALDVLLTDGDALHLEREKIFAEEFILSLETSSGRKIKLQLPDIKMPGTKNASGYFVKKNMDAVDLFVGSEGTLGFIAEAKLKLIKKPSALLSCIVFFKDENNALNFIADARNISYMNRQKAGKSMPDARALEFFDANSLQFLKPDFPNIKHGSKAAVWFEQETGEAEEDELFEAWIRLIKKHGAEPEAVWYAYNLNDQNKIKEFRHAVSLKVNEYISKNNFTKLGTDAAVPDDKFKDFYFEIKQMIEREKIDFVAYGHFGNSHVHLNMLPKNKNEFETGRRLYAAVCKRAVELNGTVSAEHGIGKMKRDYLLMMYGRENIVKMAEIKRQFDPNFILNAGNLFEESILEK